MAGDERAGGPPRYRGGSPDDGSRWARWRGVVGLSASRLWTRATRTRSSRLAATIAAVSLTIALLLVVTGVAVALADGGVETQTDADVGVTPESSEGVSAVDGIEGTRLGETNERAGEIREADGVDHASPALVEPTKLEGEDGEERTVLLVGVVPDDDPRTVAGLTTDGLASGDPHYADGSYDGQPTNEIVLSEAAAEDLDVSTDDDLEVAGSAGEVDGESAPSVSVTAVEEAGGDRSTDAPVALVHLSELQTLSGASESELADRVLVWGESEAASDAAAEEYPDAAVESNDARDPSALFDDGLAFATAALATVVGVTICAAFVATTLGMAVADDRRALATLEAVGYPARGRLAVVAVSTVLTTLCGAGLGVLLGAAGIAAVNAVAEASFAPGVVAAFHPLFVPYAFAVALASGLVATPYPLAIAARTSALEEVGR
ncbi:ABC transporter permease [Natrialbaceae archaeon GCM10025810]|uniref:ABC transporter permease n=1 Tax=Halovalidus salilacus TaxID=3075124 RepID=UPI003610B673